jgi:hypothetical protein
MESQVWKPALVTVTSSTEEYKRWLALTAGGPTAALTSISGLLDVALVDAKGL